MSEIKSEAKLTFIEATSIIVGHGVGAGILSVPYLASRTSWADILWILAAAYGVNLLLHFMIAELSMNNGGAQFIKCFENELFTGRLKKFAVWLAFGLLGLSVVVNIAGFLTGAAAVFRSWFGLPDIVGMLIFYIIGAGVVFVGMKLVGICEKIAVVSMVGVVGVLFAATLLAGTSPLSTARHGINNILALYSMTAFSLSAVMSAPQVVKGLGGSAKRVRGAIAAGTAVNAALILLITFMTLLGAGGAITEDGALVDLSSRLGGWVGVVGYVFTLLALATSFWANTLNLRDIVAEQTKLGLRMSWLLSSVPCLVIAMLGLASFVGFTRFAGIIQVVTGLGIILAYARSRRRKGESPICGSFGTLPWRLIVIASTLISTVGSVLKVS